MFPFFLISFFVSNPSYLNGFGPLQIGGVQNVLNNPKINYGGFRGCIRNIKDNNIMYDLLNPLLERNTELGCKLENNPCPNCNDNGYCEPLWTNSICVCDLGYTGPNCNSSKIYYSCTNSCAKDSAGFAFGFTLVFCIGVVIALPPATLNSPTLLSNVVHFHRI